MSLVNNFSIPFSTNMVSLPPWEGGDNNRFTVIIGENGTRKSLILRGILDNTLSVIDTQKDIQSGFTFGEANSSIRTKKIIALSAIATDRFPSKSSIKKNLRWTKYDGGTYSYIGPRTAQNLISRNQSMLEVILAIIKKPKSAFKQSEFLLNIFRDLGLSGRLTVGFVYPFRMDKQGIEKGESFIQYLSDIFTPAFGELTNQAAAFFSQIKIHHPSFVWPPDPSTKKLISKIDNFAVAGAPSPSIYKILPEVEKKLSKASYRIDIDYEDHLTLLDYSGKNDSLHLAVLTGYLKPTSIFFTKQSGEMIDQEELSAGQWSLFSSMISMATLVENDTLILVDEPEGALHPKWQRDYLSYLRQAISHANSCQVIIATHSPLILSSLSLDHSDVIALEKNSNDDSINWSIVNSLSGWKIDEILDDAFQMDGSRGAQFTENINLALRLVAQGVGRNGDELKNVLESLRPYLLTLPENDFARSVIRSMLAAIDNGGQGE